MTLFKTSRLAICSTVCSILPSHAASIIALGDLTGGSFASEARSVSSDGLTVVGRSNSGNGGEAFQWTAGGGMTPLGDLPGGNFFSQANSVSSDGSTPLSPHESLSGHLTQKANS